MKTVRLRNNIVVEIIPEYALPVSQWYNAEFAASCVEAPDEVGHHWVYDPGLQTFSEPVPDPVPEPEPDPMGDMDALLVDHEFRLTMIELGI